MAVSTTIASDSDVRAFIEEYFEACSGTNEDLILSYYSETVSLEIPGTVINRRVALRDQFVRPFVTGFPGNHHVVKNMIPCRPKGSGTQIFGATGQMQQDLISVPLLTAKLVPKSN